MAAASLAWLPVTRGWNARGHLCWSTTIFLFVAYLAFVLNWTFASNLGLAGTVGGLLLWLFEVFRCDPRLRLPVGICDALGSEKWRREKAKWWDALQANWAESTLALLVLQPQAVMPGVVA